MSNCWNRFCILSDCDGTNHVDVTGDSWAQPRGTVYEYDPAIGDYVAPEQATDVGVTTLYAREPKVETIVTVPIPGDAVRLTADWQGAAAGCIGVLEGMLGKPCETNVMVTFRPSIFRDNTHVSASGGPGTFLRDPSVLRATGETVELRCWRFKNGIWRAHNSEVFFVTVSVWEWSGAN